MNILEIIIIACFLSLWLAMCLDSFDMRQHYKYKKIKQLIEQNEELLRQRNEAIEMADGYAEEMKRRTETVDKRSMLDYKK